jgi:hypothetical protein
VTYRYRPPGLLLTLLGLAFAVSETMSAIGMLSRFPDRALSVAAFAALTLLMAWRSYTIRVVIEGSDLVVRNLLRTIRIDVRDVSAVRYRVDGGVPKVIVLLTSGKELRSTALAGFRFSRRSARAIEELSQSLGSAIERRRDEPA